MSHRLFYSLIGIALVLIVSLALYWPQGEGARSSAPFGHPIPETDKQRVMRERELIRLQKSQSDAQKSAARLEAQNQTKTPPPNDQTNKSNRP